MAMPKQPTLRPSDIVVALQLMLESSAQFKQLAESTGISAGECHNAVRRLRLSQLVQAGERRPSSDALHQFLVQGVPFAFPAVVGAGTIGIATAYSSSAFRGIIESPDHFVWPDAAGPVRGQSLTPLFPGAPALPSRNQPLYELLAIVDALRVGTTRVRKVAAELLASRFADTRA
jgi:hypothetical protein